MKKKIFVATLLISLAFLCGGIAKVNAQNGPSDQYCYIAFYGDEQSIKIYEPNKVNNDALAGATYDKASNTLTLNNLTTDLSLEINEMGDDFKINLVGENSIPYISVWGYEYGGSLEITGKGSLTVNGSKELPSAFRFYAEGVNAKFEIASTATVKMYASEEVIAILQSTNSNPATSIVLKKGFDISKSISSEEMIFDVPKTIPAIMFNESGNSKYTIAKKDGKDYGVTRLSGGSYILTNEQIAYDTVNGYYFFDTTTNTSGLNHSYDNLEAVEAAGYQVTDEEVTINHYVSINKFCALSTDGKGNEYATYSYYSDGVQNVYVYDVSENQITLGDGEKYYVLVKNDTVDGSTLTQISNKENSGLYKHIVNLKELEVYGIEDSANNNEEVVVEKIVTADDEKSNNDKNAANEVNKLLDDVKNGKDVSGMSDSLIEQIDTAITNGDTISVELDANKVDNANVSEEVKEAVNEKIEKVKELDGANILGYFDINMIVKVNDTPLNEKVTELKNEIEVSLDVSNLVENLEKVKTGMVRKYYVIRIHGTQVDVIPATLNNDGTLTFKTDRFSSYTVAYNDVANVSSPNTGDSIINSIILFITSVLGLVVIGIYSKKRYNN